jgi:type IV pilus assembly protein PilC
MIYRYTAYARDKRIVSGTIESTSLKMAEDSLYTAGFERIVNLEQTRSGIDWKKIGGGSVKINKEGLLDFTTELSILTESGLTLLLALRQLEKQSTAGNMKQIITRLASDLQGGSTFHQALAKHPQIFSEAYCSVMEANEKAGTLDAGLRQLAKELKTQIAIKSQVQRAITQPLIIVVLAFAVVILLTIVVLPPLADIFRQMGADLPLTTRILIGLSDFINANLLTIFIVVAFLVVSGIIIFKNPSTKPVMDKFILNLPVFGQLVSWNNTAYFSRTLSNLLGAGILLPDSINIMLKGIGNSYYRGALAEARKQLVQGQSLSAAISRHKVFPPLLNEMIGVGETSGNLEFALGTVAEYFETKVEKRIARLTSLLEPALILGVGLVVGFIAVTMISTIYGLVGTFQG